MQKATYIFLSGHRNISKNDYINFRLIFSTILERIIKTYTNIVFLTQLADGSDQLLATVALENDYSINAVIPMGIKDFCALDLNNIVGFNKIINEPNVKILEMNMANTEDSTNRNTRDKYYSMANEYCLNIANLVIVIWDGEYATNGVGTAAVVQQSLSNYNIPVYWIPSKDIYNKDKILEFESIYNCRIKTLITPIGNIKYYYMVSEG